MSDPPTATTSTSAATGGRPLVITAGITMALIALQLVLAGYGIFERQYHKADDGWFEPHQVVGYLTLLATLALLVVTIVTRQGRGTVVRAAVIVVLVVLQPLFAGLGTDTNPWFGVLHALDAVVIAALTGTLIGQGVREGRGG